MNPNTGHISTILTIDEEVTSPEFSPVSSSLTTGQLDGKITIWNVKGTEPTIAMNILKTPFVAENLATLSYSHSGKYLALGYGDGTINILDTNTEELVRTLYGNTNSAESISYSPHDKYLAIGFRSGYINIVNTTNWREECNKLGKGPEWPFGMLKISYSPNGNQLVGVSKIAKVFNTQDCRLNINERSNDTIYICRL